MKLVKKSLFQPFLYVILGFNAALILAINWKKVLQYIAIQDTTAMQYVRIFLTIEVVTFILGILILIEYRSKIINSIKGIKLTYRILIAFVLGIILGIFLRYNPNFLDFLGIDAKSFKSLGKIFIDLIKMIISPLILISITCSVMGTSEDKGTSKMVIYSIISFLSLTVISVSMGVGITKFLNPGGKVSPVIAQEIIDSNKSEAQKITLSSAKVASFSDFILDVVPENIFKSLQNSHFLQIIFFSIILGMAIKAARKRDEIIGKGMLAMNQVMFKITELIMQIAPLGIFGFVVWIVGTQDISLLKSLGMVIAIVYISTLIMIYVVYSIIISCFLKLNPLKFFKKIAHLQFSGYLLASSSAVLPQTLITSQEKLGISKEKALFVIPLGATVNMSGTALNLGVSVIFISQIFGVNFDYVQLMAVVGLCTLGAIGTAPVPGASIFLLSGILAILNLPIEAIAIILAIDRILDMMRTMGNITGDILSAVIVDKCSNTLNKEIWDN